MQTDSLPEEVHDAAEDELLRWGEAEDEELAEKIKQLSPEDRDRISRIIDIFMDMSE